MKRKNILPIVLATMMLTACAGNVDGTENANTEASVVQEAVAEKTTSEIKNDDSVAEKSEAADAATSADTQESASLASSAGSEASTAASSAKTDVKTDAKTDAKTDSKSNGAAVVDGTWQTASIGYIDGDDMQPNWYVVFTGSTVDYGHKKNGEFVLDHSDKISNSEKTSNGVKIQAQTSDGAKYTLKTAEGDADTLEYYSTWEESSFADSYSGSSSLCKCVE